MDDDYWWNVIENTRKGTGSHQEHRDKIYQFHCNDPRVERMVSFSLFWTDKMSWLKTAEILDQIRKIQGGISEHEFECFCECLVACGKDLYEGVLNDPTTMGDEKHPAFYFGEHFFLSCGVEVLHFKSVELYWELFEKATERRNKITLDMLGLNAPRLRKENESVPNQFVNVINTNLEPYTNSPASTASGMLSIQRRARGPSVIWPEMTPSRNFLRGASR